QTTTTSPGTGPGSAPRSARFRRRWLGVGSTLGLVGALSISAVHADVTLGPRVDYPVQSSPREAVLADFDGDGHLDAAVTNAFGGSISILTNDGTGACSTVHLPISGLGAGEPTSIASGDFNEDGHADLVVGNQYSDNFALLLGNGDNTFGASTLVPVANYAFTVAVGDVNEDGHLDVASGSRHRQDIAIHLGNGDGTFAAPVTFAMDLSVFDVHLTDLDGDGHL